MGDIVTISLNYLVDGGGSAVATGINGDIYFPYNCTINNWVVLADTEGNLGVDLWKTPYTTYPATEGNSICGTEIALNAVLKNSDANLTGWTTSISANDTLRVYIRTASTIERFTMALDLTKAA
jgi:hypothetical protein